MPCPSGAIQSTVVYDLALDSTRSRPRAIFDETKNNTRRQTRVMGLSQMCETLTLRLPVSRKQPQGPPSTGWAWEAEEAGPPTDTLPQDCVEESVIPIVLRLNFSLEGQPLSSFGNLRPVLAVDAQTLFTASVSPAGRGRNHTPTWWKLALFHFKSYFVLLLHFTSFRYFLSLSFIISFFSLQFPFEKNCGNDSVCQDDLSISFSFMK